MSLTTTTKVSTLTGGVTVDGTPGLGAGGLVKKTVVLPKKPTKEMATPAEIADALGPTASSMAAAVRAGVSASTIATIKKTPGRPKAPDADAKKAAAEALKAAKAQEKALLKAAKDAKKARAKERVKRVKEAERAVKKATTAHKRASDKLQKYDDEIPVTTKTGKALDRLLLSRAKAQESLDSAQESLDAAVDSLDDVKTTVQNEQELSDIE